MNLTGKIADFSLEMFSQTVDILPFWVLGIIIRSVVSVFLKKQLTKSMEALKNFEIGVWGVVPAAGIPLYFCGGGIIPLLKECLANGISAGAATAFMLTGPATKITNLGALKIVLGMRNFTMYIGFVVCFSVVLGIAVDLIYKLHSNF